MLATCRSTSGNRGSPKLGSCLSTAAVAYVVLACICYAVRILPGLVTLCRILNVRKVEEVMQIRFGPCLLWSPFKQVVRYMIVEERVQDRKGTRWIF